MTQHVDQLPRTDFSQEAAEAISRAANEPSWARERRMEAWRVYEDTPMPSRTDEGWRRTDLAPLQLSSLAPYVAASHRELESGALREWLAAVSERAGLVLQGNSEELSGELDGELRNQGVVFTSLSRALQEHPDLVEPYLLSHGLLPTYNKFAALNSAFWSAGTFLYVPRGVVVEKPLLSARTLTADGAVIMPRTIIVLEPGSSALYVDLSASETHERQAMHCGVTDIFLKDNTEFRYAAVQEWGRNVWDFSMSRAQIGSGAKFSPVLASLGARVSRVHLEAILDGAGAEAKLEGVYFGDSNQHFDYQTLQDHVSPYGASKLVFKGALKNKASAAYEGTVHVGKGAIRTSASQENRNLLLNPGAKADSIPILEIEASDIDRCSHGATVGQVDEESLFYLMCRGLTRSEAKELLVGGFFAPVIDSVPVEGLQQRLRMKVGEKLAL